MIGIEKTENQKTTADQIKMILGRLYKIFKNSAKP